MCYFQDLAQRSFIKWFDLHKSLLKKGMKQKMQQMKKTFYLFTLLTLKKPQNSYFVKAFWFLTFRLANITAAFSLYWCNLQYTVVWHAVNSVCEWLPSKKPPFDHSEMWFLMGTRLWLGPIYLIYRKRCRSKHNFKEEIETGFLKGIFTAPTIVLKLKLRLIDTMGLLEQGAVVMQGKRHSVCPAYTGGNDTQSHSMIGCLMTKSPWFFIF